MRLDDLEFRIKRKPRPFLGIRHPEYEVILDVRAVYKAVIEAFTVIL